jgi:RimJ/RimL family protein N-acetyltransferase
VARVTTGLLLRDVVEADVPIFFEHQLDPVANELAAFPPRDRDAFTTHWAKILADEASVIKTVVVDGHVAGNVLSFEHEGQREVGYWLGRTFWGKGVATSALAKFLVVEKRRPLLASVARHNIGSIRVLEKCGFAISSEDEKEVVLELR